MMTVIGMCQLERGIARKWFFFQSRISSWTRLQGCCHGLLRHIALSLTQMRVIEETEAWFPPKWIIAAGQHWPWSGTSYMIKAGLCLFIKEWQKSEAVSRDIHGGQSCWPHFKKNPGVAPPTGEIWQLGTLLPSLSCGIFDYYLFMINTF